MRINQRELIAVLLAVIGVICVANACRSPGHFISDESAVSIESPFERCIDSIDDSECEYDTLLANYK